MAYSFLGGVFVASKRLKVIIPLNQQKHQQKKG